jgi:hypothetical protein
METLAHNNVYSFVADGNVRNGIHSIDGRIEMYDGSHPIVFIESGGHGIYGTQSPHARYDVRADRFTGGTGITYIYKGIAERPKHANDRKTGYDLLPIYTEWWAKAAKDGGWSDRTFDGFFSYQPFGGRPGVVPGFIGGAFYGRAQAENKAKPFWGWHDNRTLKQKALAVGQWGLDPAYAVSQNLRFPAGQPFSLDYVYNPFLNIQNPGTSATLAVAPVAPVAPVTPVAPPAPASGTFEFSVWVDGTVEAIVRGSEVTYQVVSGAPVQNPAVTAGAPFPASAVKSVRVTVRSGRGHIQLVEPPSEQNGFAAKLRIEDPSRGGATYRVALVWEQ